MISETTINEQRVAGIVADEYRKMGYDVAQGVELDFLPSFRADLLARKGDEAIIVEVKTRAGLTPPEQITELMEAVKSRPGCSFELVLVGEPEKADAPAPDAAPLSAGSIIGRLEQAERMMADGAADIAFLLAWPASEAALRALLAEAGVPPERMAAPNDVFGQAVFHGLMSQEDYRRFSDMRKYRNAIVHGFEAEDFDSPMASTLIGMARQFAAYDPQRYWDMQEAATGSVWLAGPSVHSTK